MARKIAPVRSNPVVFFSDRTEPPGWVYRAAGAVALHGPFSGRAEAVAYALRALADPAGARTLAAANRGRRAA
ncbi:MAG: hypothetical protein WCO00_02120 [Rhodospirillaceae bacterium]